MGIMQQGETLQEEPTDAVLDNTVDNQQVPPPNNGSSMKRIAIIIVAVIIIVVLVFFFLKDKKGVGDEEADKLLEEMEGGGDDGVEVDDTTLEEEDPDAAFDDLLEETDSEMEGYGVEYSMTEIEQLRAYGYTGDEIEVSSSMGVSYDSLIEQAEAAMEAKQAKILKKLGKRGSKAYKELSQYTFLVNPRTAFKNKWFKDGDQASSIADRQIVDYRKLPTYGNQLWVQVDLDSGEKGFIQMTPERWVAIPKSGNMVIDVITTKFGKEDIIISIKEIPQTYE